MLYARLFWPVAILMCAGAQAAPPDADSQKVPLVVPAGVPLRVYLTKRLTKHLGEPVEAKLLEPLFAFDRQVAPAGSVVLGEVTALQAVTKMRRTRAVLGGDFTPLHEAEVRFTTLILPDGRKIALQTEESTPLDTIVPLHPRKPRARPQNQNGGILGMGKRRAQAQIDAAKDKVASIADAVRAPCKKERIEDFLMAKLPYHPQWVRNRTRFDAELREPLQFGTATLKNDDLKLLGTQPAPDSVAHVRLLTKLNSASAKQGDPIEAVLTEPLFSADKKLVLPEGTHATGTVTIARGARWFHRGGQLRFTFQKLEVPQGIVRPAATPAPAAPLATHATLASAEAAGAGTIKVDEEGGVKATEPKTRFIAPAISVLIANKSADNDAERRAGHVGGADGNVSGRSLGGVSGFGVLGMAASQISPAVGTFFGFYGMAWSVYSNIISRGAEVQFDKNTAMEIRFGARVPATASKLRASRGAGGGE